MNKEDAETIRQLIIKNYGDCVEVKISMSAQTRFRLRVESVKVEYPWYKEEIYESKDRT